MIDQGYYNTITLDQCIASAKMQLNIEVSDHDIYLERLANEAIRHIDSLSIYEKAECNLTINDGKAKLPNGFYRLLGIKLNTGKADGYLTYIDYPFLSQNGIKTADNRLCSPPFFQIQNGYMFFNSDSYSTASTVNIAYIRMNVNEDGLMCVRMDMERAVVAYLCYMFTLQNSQLYSQWQMMEHKQTWIAQKAWIQGMDLRSDFMNKRRQIAAITNAWVVEKQWFI